MNITDEQILNFVYKVFLPSVLGAGGHLLKKKLLDKSSNDDDLIGDIGIITSEIRDVLTETPVQRFLVFRVGADKKNRKESCILEDFRRPFKSVYYDYQDLDLDADYVRMMNEVEKDIVHQIVTSKLENDSILKRIYEAEGVKYSCVFLIYKSKDYMYYASAATSENIQEYSKLAKNRIELTRGKIKSIFEKHKV